jgi:RecB family exonuclease
VPEPSSHLVRRLSYSALALFGRCSYRFYAERIVGLSPDGAGDRADRGAGLSATEIGDAVHALLETGAPAADAAGFLQRRFPDATQADAERVAQLVAAWHGSALARRLSTLEGVKTEQPFAFEQDGVLLHGRFDLIHRAEGRILVVDYKTNRLEEESPAQVVDREYELQRLVYALAALRAAAQEVEVAYVFLERVDDVVRRSYGPADAVTLESELSDAISAIQVGDFRPTPGELACSGCPALDRICAGPRLPLVTAGGRPETAVSSS